MGSIKVHARQIRHALTVTLTALTGVILTANLTGPLPAQAINDDSQVGADVARVQITQLTPRVLSDETTVQIQATINSPTDLEDVDINFYMRSDSFVTAAQMQAYLDGDTRPGQWVTTQQVEKVAANTATTITMKVDRDRLPLGSTWEWGPRGITVTATSEDGTSTDRSVLIWDSGYQVEPTRIAVIAPITRELTVLPGGNVDYQPLTQPQVQAAQTLAQTPGVILAASADIWQSQPQLTRQLQRRDATALALPQGDADLAAIAQLTERTDLMELTETSLQTAFTASDGVASPEWVLAQAPQLDRQTIAAWAGYTVVAPADIAPLQSLTYHPSLFSRYRASTGEPTTLDDPDGVNVVVPQGELSTLIGTKTPQVADQLDVSQMLIANSAIITRELPNQSRAVVALAARGTDLELVSKHSQQLLQQRWVEPLTAADLEFTDEADLVEREPLMEGSQIAGAITAEQANSGVEALQSIAATASAVPDPTTLTTTLRQQLLALTSIQLRLEPDQRQQLLNAMWSGAEEIDDLVTVAQSAPINLLDAKANLPVRVENSYAEPVEVVVHLRPSDPRLQVKDSVALQVPANSSALAEIPVNAVGSGNVTIRVIVKSNSGLVIDDRTDLTVRVRAGWESTATLIGAILLGLMVLVGIVRTVRRGRRMDTVEDEGFDGPEQYDA